LSAGGTNYALTQTSYDALGRVDCSAVRMNIAVYGSLPASACSLSTQGSDGPDRISQLVYDPAGQLTQLKVGVGTTDAATERTLTYTNNGLVSTLLDAETNLTTYVYDGFDRLKQTQYPNPTKGSGTSNPADYEQLLNYDANSNVGQRRLRDGSVIAFTYDNLDRVTLKDLPGTEPNVSYGYDNLGRLTSASQTGNNLSFGWDALSRKTSEGGPHENVHLPDAFVEWVRETYGGTRLGRQELGGELIAEVEGALFTRAVLEASRAPALTPGPSPASGRGEIRRIVVGVDPPASAQGTCGIVVCGADSAGVLYVLADASVCGASPERWASAVAAAAEAWGADRVVAEKNQGGDMVGDVLRQADVSLPLKLVSASRGKVARAEPVAMLFENGRARLAGRFPELEDELAGLLIGGDYAGPGRSPDRADACVWALSALMRRRGEPRIRSL
jgi:YD repeat-containing protein